MTTWTKGDRDKIVSRYHEIISEMGDAEFSVNALEGEAKQSKIDHIVALSGELYNLSVAYEKGLACVALSRCPLTNTLMYHSFDEYDLRGLWWRSENPNRPRFESNAGSTFVALTGAIRLNEPVEYTKFVVHPGPAAPFVIPTLLELHNMRATLSSRLVGKHTAFMTTYFSHETVPLDQKPTIWGTQVPDLNPNYRWDDYLSDDHRRYDFDLKPWIDSGKLSWISRDDTSMTLMSSSADCPYLNIEGTHHNQYVSVGCVTVSSI